MDASLTLQLNQVAQEVALLNEYIQLKFGSDFKEFRTFKAANPDVGMVLVPKNGPYRDEDVNNEEQENSNCQREQVDDDEVEIGDQGVTIDWEDGPPKLEPEDVNFNDDDFNGGGFQCHYNNDDDSSAPGIGRDGDESTGLVDNSSQSNAQISPTPTPNKPMLRPKRKTPSVNSSPKEKIKRGKKGDMMKSVENPSAVPNDVTVSEGNLGNDGAKDNLEKSINPKNPTDEQPPRHIWYQKWSEPLPMGLARRRKALAAMGIKWSDPEYEEQDNEIFSGRKSKTERAKVYDYFDPDKTFYKMYICKRCKTSHECLQGEGTRWFHNHLEWEHPDLYEELNTST